MIHTIASTTRLFGYVLDRQRWERMIIVYVSTETMGPAFLGAALIQQFKGPLLNGKVLPLCIASLHMYVHVHIGTVIASR